ncbi:MAG: hypothetical protein AAF368_11450, partial [Planctomycetota bacterium]
EIFLGERDAKLLTPSLTRPDAGEEDFFVELRTTSETGRARLGWSDPGQFGQHTWQWSNGPRIDPVLDGSLWVKRSRNTARVWLPRDGRVLCSVGLYDFNRTFCLNGTPLPEDAWGPGQTRRFDITMGLDLDPGQNVLEGALWKATAVLEDRIALYIDESDSAANKLAPCLLVTLPETHFTERSIQLAGQAPRAFEGNETQGFETEAATLRFTDAEGRENRIEIELREDIGLRVRVGSALLR